MNEENDGEVLRLPLWKNALEELEQNGLSYGQTIGADWFEERLKQPRNSMRFGLDISKIRRELEHKGFYLTARGQKGNQFVILPPESNRDVMAGYQREAIDALRRGVILGTNTRLDTLSDADRRKHEGMLEKLAVKAALMQRSTQIFKAVSKYAPKLIETKAA